MSEQPILITANTSKLMIDGKDVPGVQSIDFRMTRNVQNQYQLGSQDRMGGYMGGMFVEGTIRVKSTYPPLDQMLTNKTEELKEFSMVVELLPQGANSKVRKIAFSNCYVHGKTFGIDTNGVFISSYTFTATNYREE